MTKKRIRITDGGIALPLGNNTFLMRGRLHSQGGIGIGNGGKNDIEVEDGEVVKFNKNNIQVLSDQPMLNGISPANALLAGGSFNKIFKAQQSINGNYGGSYAENGTNKDDIAYNKFVESLPDNQRYTDTTKYDMRRYWELNGKPKNFKESINREEPMFHLENDDYYHASTIAWNDKGEGEFIKNRNHETIGLEIGSYLRDKNHPLRNKEYILDATGNKIKYRKRTPSETILPEGAYIGDLKENQKYGIGGIIKKIIDSFTNDKKENTDKENKKDAPIDWDEIKIKQAYTESGFNSKAVSKAPAYGLYQITPQTLKEFNDKTGNSYKIEDLYNDKINTEIRDWYMNDLYNREWNTKNNPSDSVRATKTIMAYNMGPTNLVNRLNELKAKGYDIYQSLDWTQDDSIPVESREYNDFILRNMDNSIGRNQLAYETSKKKNSDKVEGIRKGFKDGGIKQLNDSTSVNYHINNKEAISVKDADNYGYGLDWITNWLSKRYSKLDKNERNYDRDDFLFNHDFGLIDLGQQVYDENVKSMLSTPIIIDERFKHLYKNIGNINKTYSYDDFPYIKDIMESNYSYGDKKRNINDVKRFLNYSELGHFQPYGRHIYLTPDANESTLIHELTHTFGYPQKRLISNNKKLKENIEEDYYLDSSDEIYSRLMQFREANNINPEHKYTEEDLKKLKENAKDFNLLNRYTDDTILYFLNDIAKNNNKNKNNNVFYAKNGGQINMKLKHKNKQDITDIVMNEILPHSTGERKKFIWGGSEIALASNAGLNLLSGLGQGIAGSINADGIRKMYDGLKRQSTFIPVAREHINTKVDVEPQLNLTAQTEYNLRRNAEMNTANAKVARSQARVAALDRIRQDNAIYGDKYNREIALRNAEAELQTKYNLVDLENKLTDIREQNDFDMQKAIGRANAGTMEAQTWGNAIASTLGNTATSVMDYMTMQNDLLKSDNPAAYDQWFKSNYGHLFDKNGKLKVGVNGDARKEWFNKNKAVMDRLGWTLPS